MAKQTICNICKKIIPDQLFEDGDRVADVAMHVYRCSKTGDEAPLVKPGMATYDWCNECLTSFEEWLDSREKSFEEKTNASAD